MHSQAATGERLGWQDNESRLDIPEEAKLHLHGEVAGTGLLTHHHKEHQVLGEYQSLHSPGELDGVCGHVCPGVISSSLSHCVLRVFVPQR